MRKLNPSEPVVSANAVPSTRKAGSKTSKASGARAAKHSKAVVEELVNAPSVAAPVVDSPAAGTSAASAAAAVAPVVAEPVAVESFVVESVTPVAAEAAPVAPRIVSHEEIAKLAYCYWADRGYQGGSPQEDWARAEQTLLAGSSAS